MLHGFHFLAYFLSTLALRYSNASNSNIFQYQGPITEMRGAQAIKLIMT